LTKEQFAVFDHIWYKVTRNSAIADSVLMGTLNPAHSLTLLLTNCTTRLGGQLRYHGTIRYVRYDFIL